MLNKITMVLINLTVFTNANSNGTTLIPVSDITHEKKIFLWPY